jgi:enoyl-CoA hydratase
MSDASPSPAERPAAAPPLRLEDGAPTTSDGTLLELRDPSDPGVLILALNRPTRRNALSPELLAALDARIEQAERSGEVRAIVLGAVGGVFCAGGDLGGGMGEGGFLAAHAQRGLFARALLRLAQGPIPVVAAVAGDALGGGFGLAMAARMVVMAEGARLGTPELRLGLFPMMIWPILARNLPSKLLHELVLTDRRLTAAEALAVGAINAVAPADAVLDRALALARAVAGRSPAVVRLGLGAVATVEQQPLHTALQHLHSQLSLNLMTDDAAEGVSAFLERRPPVWSGR